MVGLSESMKAMMARKKASYAKGGDKPYKLKEGKTRVRVLPAEFVQNGESKIWTDCGVHWVKTSKDAKPAAVVGNSLVTHGIASDVEAFIDQALQVAKDQGDEAMVEVFKDMRARKSVIINGLIQDGADKSDAPKLIELTPTCWGDMLGTILTYAEEGVDILDLETGIDFIVERTGKGLDTNYAVMVAPKASKVAKSVLEKVVDPMTYIEKELYRGDEPKALQAISNMTGLPAPGAPKGLLSSTTASRPAAAALTAPKAAAPSSRKALSAVIEEPVVVEEEVPADEPVEEVPDTSAEDDAAAIAAELEAAEAEAAAAAASAALAKARAAAAAAKKGAPAAKPAATKPAAAKPAAKSAAAPSTAPESFGEDLPSDELDAALADLDNL